MVLVAVRHALSVFNVLKKSRPDCALSSEGMQQAKLLSGHFSHIVCSPLRRAKQTLELSGITYNSLEYNELARELRDDVCDFTASEPQVRESYIEFADRIVRLNQRLESVEASHPEVLLVAHAYVILAIARIRENKRLPMDEADGLEIATEYSTNCIPNARFIELPASECLASTNYRPRSDNCCNRQSEGTVVP
jgi:broad specificity phosphatase PhoE